MPREEPSLGGLPLQQAQEVTALRRVAVLLTIAALLPTAASCRRAGAPGRNGQAVSVIVSVEPLAYFVERIGGRHVAVGVLVAAGQDPHTYSPTAKQSAELADAQVLFRVGMPFEDVLVRRLSAGRTGLSIVDLRESLPPDEVRGPDAEAIDPHTWLSPKLASLQAEAIFNALVEADPQHREDYERNFRQLRDELAELDATISEMLAPAGGRTIYVAHPAFGHFCRRYGLRQRAIEREGKTPGQRYINEFIDEARAAGATTIFVQPQHAGRTADTVARQLGAAVVVLDPMSRDYPRNLRTMAGRIRTALAGDGQ